MTIHLDEVYNGMATVPVDKLDNQELWAAIIAIYTHPKTNGYAKSYCQAWLNGHRDKVQLLYILNNITHLRDVKGESRVKQLRSILKEATK